VSVRHLALRALGGAALAIACAISPLERGERLYREGDRVAALGMWRSVPPTSRQYVAASARIAAVEAEFSELVGRHLQRARYFERADRLAESLLDYRIALELQPDEPGALEHVQVLARTLDARKRSTREAFERLRAEGKLGEARVQLATLRQLDPFEPELESEERRLEGELGAEIERRLAVGKQRFAAGDFKRAEREFAGVLALDPQHPAARGHLAFLRAVREVRGQPGDPGPPLRPELWGSDTEIRAEGLHQNALAAERSGDLFGALRYDTEALEAAPKHARARAHLASVRQALMPQVEELVEAGRRAYEQEDLETALELWRRALLVDPGHARASEYASRAQKLVENLERLRGDTAAGAP
jgi:tetratricopeptide (TPR) repeat protein